MLEYDVLQKTSFELTHRERSLATYAQKFFYAIDGKAKLRLLEWIASDPLQRFCDFGCGEGVALSKIRTTLETIETWGVDLYPAIPTPDYIESANFENLPFDDGFFGRGVSVSALGCYAENRKELKTHFTEIYRVLSPGGRLLLAPFVDHQTKDLFAVQIPSKGVGGNITTENSFQCALLELAKECGFRISRKHTMYERITGIEFVR